MTDLSKILLPWTISTPNSRSRPSLRDVVTHKRLISSKWYYSIHRVVCYTASYGNPWSVIMDEVIQHNNIATEQEAKDILDQMLINDGYRLLTQDEADKYLMLL